MAVSRLEVDEFVSWVKNVIEEVGRLYDTADDIRQGEYIALVESVLTNVVRLHDLIPNSDIVTTSLQHLLQALTRSLDSPTSTARGASHYNDQRARGQLGRPAFHVPRDQMEYLLSFQFQVPDIARLFGISHRTARRRLAEYGLSSRRAYSEMTDDQLIDMVREVKCLYSTCGERMLDGHLRSRGKNIQRHRLRAALQEVDSEGVALRFRLPVRRRSYSVRSPNSLWHIDGNHKLIRWRLVIHGGVDGFTRIPVYMGCSNNNRAETVFGLFLKAVDEYGLPSRVRSDRGGENIAVKRYMEEHPQRGEARGSMLMGRSVHNQRIERFWRDLFAGCTCLFYNLFYYLENANLLDPCNASDIFCLHYVFLPRINQQISSFVEGWNRHRIRTAGNRTPLQLWVQGMLQRRFTGDRVIRELYEEAEENLENFGIDWNGPVSYDDDDFDRVCVPHEECPLLEEEYEELKTAINPLADSCCYGTDLYLQTVEFVAATIAGRD